MNGTQNRTEIVVQNIDVDAAIAAACQDWTRLQYEDRDARFFIGLGMMDPANPGNINPTGSFRRFAAGLKSVRHRADGNTGYTFIRVSLSDTDHSYIEDGGAADDRVVGAFALTQWSYTGTWGPRAWWYEMTVFVRMDDCGRTYITVGKDAVMAVAGNGGVTEFKGLAVGLLLEGSIQDLLARHQMRQQVGINLEKKEPVSFDRWLEEATEHRDYVVALSPPTPVTDDEEARVLARVAEMNTYERLATNAGHRRSR